MQQTEEGRQNPGSSSPASCKTAPPEPGRQRSGVGSPFGKHPCFCCIPVVLTALGGGPEATVTCQPQYPRMGGNCARGEGGWCMQLSLPEKRLWWRKERDSSQPLSHPYASNTYYQNLGVGTLLTETLRVQGVGRTCALSQRIFGFRTG